MEQLRATDSKGFKPTNPVPTTLKMFSSDKTSVAIMRVLSGA